MTHAIGQTISVFAIGTNCGMAAGVAIRHTRGFGSTYVNVTILLGLALIFAAMQTDNLSASPQVSGWTEAAVDLGVGCLAFAAGIASNWPTRFARLGRSRPQTTDSPKVQDGLINGE